MHRRTLLLAGFAGLSLLGIGGAMLSDVQADAPVLVERTSAGATRASAQVLHEPIVPISRAPLLDEDKVALGKRLFSETRLSADNTISCISCHDLAAGGDDGRARSIGIHEAEGTINAPTVLNSSLNFKLFWDGRADSLESQLDGPVHDPKEMATSWPEVVAKLARDDEYVRAFASLYPRGIREESIKDALAAFERSLLTPGSRFDRYLRGEPEALTDQEKKGYRLFKNLGCIACHQGMNAGGNMFQTLGVMGDYFADRGGETKADLGRFNVTGLPEDRHRFRVPGLRNVELTAPYFHDGSAATLGDAVRTMAKYQLGEQLADEQVALIVAFLRTLTGEQPSR